MLTSRCMFRNPLVIFLLLLGFSLETKAQDSVPYSKEWQQLKIDSFMKHLNKRGVFNGTVLVAKQGQVYYHESFGYAHLKSKDSMNNELRYQMASVSKPITASAIMLLVQRGEVNLEDKITKYFPELILFHRVKVKHLLNHTSGLPEYIYRAGPYWKKDAYMSNEELIKFLAKRKYRPRGTPGTKFNYCNTNYALLASIVERVSEESFDEFVKKEIFQPLGMCKSFIFHPEHDSAGMADVTGYAWTGRYFKPYGFDYRNGIMGDKGLFSTADDLMRFAESFDDDNLWCKETSDLIFTKTKLIWGGMSEYGMGWRMREWDDMRVQLHYGFWNSFRTGMIHFPDSKVTFIILNNLTGGHGSRINNREQIIYGLMDIMFPPKQKEEVVAETDKPKVEEQSESDSEQEEPDTKEGEGE